MPEQENPPGKTAEETPESEAPASGAAPSSGEPSSEESPASSEATDAVAEAQAEVAKVRDQLLRTAADFDNFRKRARRETEDANRRGRDDLLKDLLPVFDNLERAAAHADEATEVKALADGINLVIKQFADTLQKIGVERVPSVGEAFDPALHEAIQHMETSAFPPGVIAAEVQAGYRAGDRLIRPSMVVVAKAPSSDGDAGAPSGEGAN